jgi:hypothetical protein
MRKYRVRGSQTYGKQGHIDIDIVFDIAKIKPPTHAINSALDEEQLELSRTSQRTAVHRKYTHSTRFRIV